MEKEPITTKGLEKIKLELRNLKEEKDRKLWLQFLKQDLMVI